MPTICLHDKKLIEQFLRKNAELHIYDIGDLDDFFWPCTTWYGLTTDNVPEAIVLLYTGQTLPTLLALSDQLTFMSENGLLFRNDGWSGSEEPSILPHCAFSDLLLRG